MQYKCGRVYYGSLIYRVQVVRDGAGSTALSRFAGYVWVAASLITCTLHYHKLMVGFVCFRFAKTCAQVKESQGSCTCRHLAREDSCCNSCDGVSASLTETETINSMKHNGKNGSLSSKLSGKYLCKFLFLTDRIRTRIWLLSLDCRLL